MALLVALALGGGDGQVVRTAAYTYLPPTVTVRQGSELWHTNLDLDLHTVTSRDTGPDGKPLFDTPFFGTRFLATERVSGVDALPPGSYAFYCRFHPALPTMRGTLVVEP